MEVRVKKESANMWDDCHISVTVYGSCNHAHTTIEAHEEDIEIGATTFSDNYKIEVCGKCEAWRPYYPDVISGQWYGEFLRDDPQIKYSSKLVLR